MVRFLPLLMLVGFQEPDENELIRRLETSGPSRQGQIIEALVSKGDAAEAAVRRRIESAPEASQGLLKSVLHRFQLQRKLRETCPAPDLIDFEAVDRPVKELIPAVERWLGLPVSPDGLPNSNVTLRIKKGTPLDALDAFHAATGLTWTLDNDRTYDQERGLHILLPPKARLVTRPRSTWPSCTSGRYRIAPTVVTLKQGGPSPSAQVGLTIEFPYRTRPHSLGSFTVSRIVDDKGRELPLIPDRFIPPHGFPRIGPGAPPVAMSRTLQFQPPAGDARSISVLGGKGRAEFIVERTYVTFEDPINKVGSEVEAWGAKVKLKEFHSAHGWMRLILDQLGPADPRTAPVEPFEYRGSSLLDFIEVVHADGRITFPETQGAGSEPGVYYRKRMMCFSTPEVKAIRLAVRSFAAYEDFTFELRDIPLPGAK